MSVPPIPLNLSSPTISFATFKHNETVVTRSRSSSLSLHSSASRKFLHFHEPTVLERPDTADEIRVALEMRDVSKLADLTATNGLPPSLRPDAWPLLLRSHPLVLRARARLTSISQLPDFKLPIKRIRSDIRNLKRLGRIGLEEEEAIYAAVIDFLQHVGSTLSYDPAMVWIAEFLINGERSPDKVPLQTSPVASPSSSPNNTKKITGQEFSPYSGITQSSSSSISSNDSENSTSSFTGIPPSDLNETFANVVLLMNENPVQFSEFVTLLRSFLPELGKHFAFEGVLGPTGGDDWLVWWLKWLGIRAFPPSTIARFWDLYFAMHGTNMSSIMKQHLYNCLVLMRGSQARLLELDQSECRQFLSNMSPCKDLEALMIEAKTLAKSAFSE